jgi:hypothetical protein
MARLKPKDLLDGIFADNKPVVGAQPGAMGNNVNPPQEPANTAVATNEMTPSITPPPTMAAYSAPQQPARVTPPAPVHIVHKVAETKPEPAAKPQKAASTTIGLRGSRAAEALPVEPKADTAAPSAAPKAAPQQQVAEAPGNFSVMNGAAAPLPSASFNARFGSAR